MASILSSITDKLAQLSIIPASAAPADSVSVKTYAFKPKGGDQKLVLVVAENDKDIGKASALAKQLGGGIKDMRAAEEDYLKDLVGEGKATSE